MLYDVNIDFGGVNFPKPYYQKGKVYIGFVSVFSGCNKAMAGRPCPQCQNRSLWFHDLHGAQKIHNTQEAYQFVRKKMNVFAGLYDNKDIQYYYVILGGEPVDQKVSDLEDVEFQVRKAIKDANSIVDLNSIPTVMFCGYDNLKKVSLDMRNYIINSVTYLKIGRYLGDKHRKTNLDSGLATENQRWIKVADSKMLTELY